MKNIIRYGFAACFLTLMSGVAQGACETNPVTVIGSPLFGATVQTFIDLGINPAVTCIENALWTNPANFGLGTYVKGAEIGGDGGPGVGCNVNALGCYTLDGNLALDANSLDFKWVQDNGNTIAFDGGVTGGRPQSGIVWDLGGQANQAVVFVFVDHGPVPGEVLENTAWLSNDPNALDAGWTQAFATHIYGFGWSADPAIVDGFAVVYTLADPSATFRYVSVTHGGPGAVLRDGDNEIDAVGGLNARGTGVSEVPEPSSVILLSGAAFAVLGIYRRRLGVQAKRVA